MIASSPITLWQTDGEAMETVRDFVLGGSKITAGGDSSHEIKRCLLLRRKAMTNLDSILKSRNITLLTKVSKVKSMAFPVVSYWCESWTIKKAKRWDWCFQTVDLEKTLEGLLDCKEIKPVNPKGAWESYLLTFSTYNISNLVRLTLIQISISIWLFWQIAK